MRQHITHDRDSAMAAGERSSEDGSMIAEYGLVAVVGATVAALAIAWARGGAITSLLDMVLRQVRSLVMS